MSWRAVEYRLPLEIDFRPNQGDAHGTLPGIPIAMKVKPARVIPIGAFMGVLGKPL